MTHLIPRPDPDPLDTATAALRAAPVPAGPSDVQAAAAVAAVHTRRRRRRGRRRALAAGLGAVVLLAVGGWRIADRAADAATFTRAMEAGNRAMSYRMITIQTKEGGTANTGSVLFDGDRFRLVLDNRLVLVGDRATGAGLYLDAEAMLARQVALKAEPMAPSRRDVAALFAKLAARHGDGVEVVGTEVFNTRRMKVYRVCACGRDDVPADAEVWVEVETGWPHRIVVPVGPGEASTVVFTDWGRSFDPRLFSLEVPAGFKVEGGKPAGGG